MGIFGNLDNLSKQQQGSQAPKQPQSKVTPTQPASPASPAPDSSTQTVTMPTPAKEADKPKAESPAKRKQPAERPNVRTNERTKIRHSFDIFLDQLLALRDLAHERQRGLSQKVPLGDLVQEALDKYLASQSSSSQ